MGQGTGKEGELFPLTPSLSRRERGYSCLAKIAAGLGSLGLLFFPGAGSLSDLFSSVLTTALPNSLTSGLRKEALLPGHCLILFFLVLTTALPSFLTSGLCKETLLARAV